MATTFPQGSAKIYDFAERARALGRGPRNVGKPADAFTTQPYLDCAYGSGWYHEAAVRETDRTRKP